VTNIPVYVNGQFVYSPAVNRVLQLAANVYDASTNTFYPDVFRPIFEHDNSGNVFIVGYTNLSSASGPNTVSGEDDPQLISPLDVSTVTNSGPSYVPITTNGSGVNVYGVPWIIGAKKGFPSFNKFGMQTIIQVSRRLQLTRSTIPTVLGTTTFKTNQLLTFTINNTLNADCWNSYSNSYNDPVNIYALDTLSMGITNNVGAPPTFFYNFPIFSSTFVPRWPGYPNNSASVALSFTNPLSATAILLTNSGFYFGTAPPGITGFSAGPAGWESNNFSLQFPQLGLLVTNWLQLWMLDYSNNVFHVIDYVQFSGPQTALNVSEAMETNNPIGFGYTSNMWSQSVNNNGVPWGILNQIQASEQAITTAGGANYWPSDLANEAEIEGFSEFTGLAGPDGGPYPSVFQSDPGDVELFITNYVVQVPFTPMVTISEYTSWQANDPLVHYLTNDLTFNGVEKTTGVQTGTQITYGSLNDPTIVPSPAFNVVNDRYQPWGIGLTSLPEIGLNAVVTNTYALTVKDPLVWSADYWDFPTNLLSDLTGLGQVHRGTPWQTIYLKAADVLQILDASGDVGSGTNTWVEWTGDGNIPDAAIMAPVNDRQLASLLISLLNTNDPTELMSVNDPNIADWLNAVNGLTVFSNSASFPPIQLPPGNRFPTTFNMYVMASNSPQAGVIATNIAQARAAQPNGNFYTVGDILSAPELTENSPW
ncbi:MAG: hypothetical protein ABSF34_14110, partial [Verrucomicrobiota bacterium]